MDDLTEQLRAFVADHRTELLSDMTRSTNRLRDLLGVRPELSVSDSRALVSMVTDGSVAEWLRTGRPPVDVSLEGPRSWASGQWASALGCSVVAPDDAAAAPQASTPVPPAPMPPPPAPVPAPPRASVPPAPESSPESSPAPSPAPPTARRQRRVWFVAAGGVAAVVLAIVAVVVFGGGDDGAAGSKADVAADVSLQLDVEQLRDGVTATRTWSVSGVEFVGTTTIANTGTEPAVVVYDEVVVKEIAASVEDITFEPAYASVVAADPIVRFVLRLNAGASTTIRYRTRLASEPTSALLARWQGSWTSANRAHLADPVLSPRDRDADGVTDAAEDTCIETPGEVEFDGCPDSDADGVPEPEDACPSEAGTLDGCLDADDDSFADTTGADQCAAEAGTLDGCLDADADSFADTTGADLCVAEAGTLDGCLDADDDGFADSTGADACVGEPGTLLGCADADSDGFADTADDRCVGEVGTAQGCLDADGDGFGDHAGVDLCVGTAGAVQGCADVDQDGAADIAGVDNCIGSAGPALGCPDEDGDGVPTAADACPARSGGGDPSGCGDPDGDGVRDDVDFCPDESGTVAGCPDSDGDGVANGGDKCPNERAPGTRDGCLDRDRDNDGVLDSVDACASTAGSTSYHGCPAPSVRIDGQRSICNGTSSFTAVASNATFARWGNGSTANPGTFTFNAGPQTLTATFTALDGQSVSTSIPLDVRQCTI